MRGDAALVALLVRAGAALGPLAAVATLSAAEATVQQEQEERETAKLVFAKVKQEDASHGGGRRHVTLAWGGCAVVVAFAVVVMYGSLQPQ